MWPSAPHALGIHRPLSDIVLKCLITQSGHIVISYQLDIQQRVRLDFFDLRQLFISPPFQHFPVGLTCNIVYCHMHTGASSPGVKGLLSEQMRVRVGQGAPLFRSQSVKID